MECEGMTSVGFYSSGLQSAFFSFLFFWGFLHHCLGGQKQTQRADSHMVLKQKRVAKKY
jgi:hypothetical protein